MGVRFPLPAPLSHLFAIVYDDKPSKNKLADFNRCKHTTMRIQFIFNRLTISVSQP